MENSRGQNRLTPPRRALIHSSKVDAFTKRAFCGNPAAVFFTHAGGDEYWMQKVLRHFLIKPSNNLCGSLDQRQPRYRRFARGDDTYSMVLTA